MWKRAGAIIDTSEQPTGRFYGLQILTEAINTHWKIIPQDHREGIRSFIVTKILTLSNDDAILKKSKTLYSSLCFSVSSLTLLFSLR